MRPILGAPPTLGEEIKSSGEITLHSATGVILDNPNLKYCEKSEKKV